MQINYEHAELALDRCHTYTSVVHQSMAFGTHTGEAAKRVLALSAFTQSVDLLTLIYVYREPKQSGEINHHYMQFQNLC